MNYAGSFGNETCFKASFDEKKNMPKREHTYFYLLVKYHSFLGLSNPGTCTLESQSSIQILWPGCLKTEDLKS